MWHNINISIIHHINHGIISPYCFIKPAIYCRCELVSTIHILTYQKASFQWATFRHLYSDKHVNTHQRYVLSLLHGWNECSSPPLCWTTPARAEGFSFTGEAPGLHQEVVRRRWGSSSGQSQTPLCTFTLHVGQPLNIALIRTEHCCCLMKHISNT